MGLDTEHAPAARVVGPPELDVAGQGPGGHRLCDSGDNRARVGALADRRRESPVWEELQHWTDDELRDLREHSEGTDPRRPRRRTGGCGSG